MSRILVIDDSEAMTQLLSDFLTSHGYEVETAGNAEEAFQSVKRQRPDLLLLDIQLPDINGFELCRHFRSRPDTRGVPIILISATAIQTQDKVQGLQQGADDYLSKPFEMPELLERIRAVMRRNGRTSIDASPSTVALTETSAPHEASGAVPALTLADAIGRALCAPQDLPAEPVPASLFFLIAITLLLAGGLASASGVSVKPLLVCLLALATWGFLVSVLVISGSVMGIELKWKSGAHLLSLAALPVLLKFVGGAALAVLTSLPPFLFTASPALFVPSAPYFLYRIDLFEIWTVVLLSLFVRRRPGATAGKALGVALVVWVSAIAWLFCIQRLGGGM